MKQCNTNGTSIGDARAVKSLWSDKGARAAVLRKAHRMQVARQLIGRVAHDFDEVLHSVLGALNEIQALICRGRTGEIGPLVDATGTSLHRAAVLSRKLLAMSRPKEYEPVPVNVNAVIASMIVLLRSVFGFKIELEILLGQNLPNTHCDPGHLETVLFNLALDAQKSIAGSGKVMIETRSPLDGSAPHAFLQISVTDTGDIDQTRTRGCAGRLLAAETESGRSGERASIEMAKHFVAGVRGHVVVDRHPDAGTAVMILLPCHCEDYGKRNPIAKRHALPNEVDESQVYNVNPPPLKHLPQVPPAAV